MTTRQGMLAADQFEDMILAAMHKTMNSTAIKALTAEQWKDGIEIERASVSATDFAKEILRLASPAGNGGRVLGEGTLARRIVEFIDENDPFGDKFCRNDTKRIETALTTTVAPAVKGEIPERETAWLIERNGTYATQSQSCSDWSTDPWRAHRFATAREADNARLRLASNTMRDQSSVTEHVFINKQPALTSAVAPDGAREKPDAAETKAAYDFIVGKSETIVRFAGEPAALALPAVVGIEGREAREKEITRLATIEECARVADSFTCGGCGMDGKAGAAIRALAHPLEPATEAGER